MKNSVLWAAALLCACSGPPAPDAALCEDVVTRLCLARTCSGLNEALAPGDDCRATLLERTGCGAEAFTFSTPSRERILECREPLVRRGVNPELAPTCEEVAEVQAGCGDVVRFFGGGQP